MSVGSLRSAAVERIRDVLSTHFSTSSEFDVGASETVDHVVCVMSSVLERKLFERAVHERPITTWVARGGAIAVAAAKYVDSLNEAVAPPPNTPLGVATSSAAHHISVVRTVIQSDSESGAGAGAGAVGCVKGDDAHMCTVHPSVGSIVSTTTDVKTSALFIDEYHDIINCVVDTIGAITSLTAEERAINVFHAKLCALLTSTSTTTVACLMLPRVNVICDDIIKHAINPECGNGVSGVSGALASDDAAFKVVVSDLVGAGRHDRAASDIPTCQKCLIKTDQIIPLQLNRADESSKSLYRCSKCGEQYKGHTH